MIFNKEFTRNRLSQRFSDLLAGFGGVNPRTERTQKEGREMEGGKRKKGRGRDNDASFFLTSSLDYTEWANF